MPDPPRLKAAVFLDRDGTICEEVGYLNHVSRFRMLPSVAPALRRLNEAGFPVIVVSNQSGVARGYFPESLLKEVTQRMTQQLSEAGARLARNAHAHGILVRTGYGEGELAWHAAKWPAPPDFVADDLAQAVDWILRQPQ